ARGAARKDARPQAPAPADAPRALRVKGRSRSAWRPTAASAGRRSRRWSRARACGSSPRRATADRSPWQRRVREPRTRLGRAAERLLARSRRASDGRGVWRDDPRALRLFVFVPVPRGPEQRQKESIQTDVTGGLPREDQEEAEQEHHRVGA